MVDNVRTTTPKAPALPLSPQVYDQASFDKFNNILRLYFTRVDDTLFNISKGEERAEATGWFLG